MRSRFALVRLLSVAFAFSTALAAAPASAESSLESPLKVSIKNFGRISEVYFRGAQPKRGDFVDLAKLGVKTVIDLTQGDSRDEPALASQAGLKFFRVPMVTTKKPTADSVKRFLEIVNDPANQPVYVHCAGGRHRTGVMTAAYRLTHDGWSADQAFAEMKKFDFLGGSWINHDALKAFVYDYYTELTTQKPGGVLATSTPLLPNE